MRKISEIRKEMIFKNQKNYYQIGYMESKGIDASGKTNFFTNT